MSEELKELIDKAIVIPQDEDMTEEQEIACALYLLEKITERK